MATFRTRPSGTVEACIRRKQLPGPIYLTFRSMEEARPYCREAEAMIDAGHVPPELLAYAKPKEARRDKPDSMSTSIREAIDAYLAGYHVSASDKPLLAVMRDEVGDTDVGAVTVQWGLDRVRTYKLAENLAPTTIRHKIGALRRCLDWHVTVGRLPLNPLKLLPTRFASYNEAEQAAVEDAPPADNARDRRLEKGEEERIRKVLAGDAEYLKEIGVERGIAPESQAPMLFIFELAIETAMRMREMFTLTWGQIDIEKRTVFLDRTKNGDSRQVPLSSVALAIVKMRGSNCKADDRVFPELWNGDRSEAGLRKGSSRLSGRWRTVARLAKCEDLRFHDLRHEATSRLFERTTMTDTKISRITGHRDPRMLRRYSNLRASDLASEMW